MSVIAVKTSNWTRWHVLGSHEGYTQCGAVIRGERKTAHADSIPEKARCGRPECHYAWPGYRREIPDYREWEG